MNGLDTPNDPPPPYQYAVNEAVVHPNNNPSPSATAAAAAVSTEREREREPTASSDSQTYTHPLRLAANTHRTDLTYPTDWANSHNVSQRDWVTFVARLFSGAGEGGSDAKRLSHERMQHIDGVIKGWNQDFFQPRGVVIRWEDRPVTDQSQPLGVASSSTAGPSRPTTHLPSHPSLHGLYQQSSPRPSPPPQPQHQPPAFSSSSSQLPSRSSLSTRNRLTNKIKDVAKGKNVSLTSTHIRVGDAFSLDAETGSVKIGKFSLTDKGMNYDGRPIGPPVPPHMLPHHHGHAHPPPPHHHPHYGPPSSFGSGPGGYHHPPPRRGHPHPYHGPGHHGPGHHGPGHHGPGHHGHGPGGPSPYSGGYGPPRHAASWGSSPSPPPPHPRPPMGSQTWGPSGQVPHGQPQGSLGYGPPPHHGPWSSYNTPQGPSSPSQGQYPSHQGQTTGTTW